MFNKIKLPKLNYNTYQMDINKPYAMTKKSIVKNNNFRVLEKRKYFDLKSHVHLAIVTFISHGVLDRLFHYTTVVSSFCENTSK